MCEAVDRTGMDLYGMIKFSSLEAAVAAQRETCDLGTRFVAAEVWHDNVALLPEHVSGRDLVTSDVTILLFCPIIMPCSWVNHPDDYICWANVYLEPVADTPGVYKLIAAVYGDDQSKCKTFDNCQGFDLGYVVLTGASCGYLEIIQKDYKEMFPYII